MTISAYLGMNTALRALQVDQEALDTVSHNIANANTPGYSRQTVGLTETPAQPVPGASSTTGLGVEVGTGVDANSLTRIRDQFLDIQYRAQNGAGTSASRQSAVLDQVQAALSEPGPSGLSAQLAAFWKSWSSLANDPTSVAARQQVVDTGQNVATTLNTLSGQLTTIQSQAATQLNALTAPTGQLVQDAQQIAQLNAAISQSQTAGRTPNDLMDQRDRALDDLSGLGTVKVTTQPNGMVDVNFGDAAAPLVSGTTVTWPQTITSATSGTLGALVGLSASGGQLAGYVSQLDGLASSLASAVNGIAGTPPFFSGTTAATLSVAATAATVQTTATGVPGAGELALQVSGLAGGAVDQSYASFIAKIGSDTQSASSTARVQSALTAAIDQQRQSTSGVSLDEEMTSMITFQRAYQAAARVMTTVDGMLDTLINHTGTVGL